MKTLKNAVHDNAEIMRNGAEWLGQYEWQYFSTLTFARMVLPERAKALFKEYANQLGHDVIYFMAVEWHKYRQCVHIHALIGKTCRKVSWPYGIDKQLLYNKLLGARHYVSKFISSPNIDWDFNFHPIDEQGKRSCASIMKTKTIPPLKAIRLKCLDCSANQPSEVRRCALEDCPLFSYRFGKNPHRKGIGGGIKSIPSISTK